jgi:hypothetical protein
MGALALFFVLTGGTAYALDGSNTVFSDDIVNGEVRQDDVAANSIGSNKIVDRSVKNADLSIGASSSNTIADGGIQGVDIHNDALTGTQIDESSMPGVSDGYAFVSPPSTFAPDGDVVEERSHNVDDSNLTIGTDPSTGDPITGVYCFDLPFVVNNIQVTALSNNRVSWDTTASTSDSGFCPGVESAYVETFNGSGSPAGAVFFFVAFF